MNPDLDMNQVGVLEGTDKSSSVSHAWDYLRHYEEWFSQWKDEEINLIEIGVLGGSSLNVWQRFFSKAHIIGMDVNPQCARFANKRVSIEIGSQEDPGFLHHVCAKYPPTIVIDDGSHQAHHIIYTFEQMFPYLLPGGIYIVEDLDFHFGEGAKSWADVAGYNPPQYFLDLSNACMTRKSREKLWGTRRNIVQTMDSIRFICSGTCIQKKKTQKRPADLRTAREYISENSLGCRGLLRYAKYMFDNGHNVSDITSELRNIELGRQYVDVDFFKVLAELQRSQGQLDEAIETLSKGAAIFGDSYDMLWRYGHWLVEAERYKDGLRVMGRAASVCSESQLTERIVTMLVSYALSRNEREVAVEALQEGANVSAHADCRRVLLDGVSRLSK